MFIENVVLDVEKLSTKVPFKIYMSYSSKQKNKLIIVTNMIYSDGGMLHIFVEFKTDSLQEAIARVVLTERSSENTIDYDGINLEDFNFIIPAAKEFAICKKYLGFNSIIAPDKLPIYFDKQYIQSSLFSEMNGKKIKMHPLNEDTILSISGRFGS